MLPARDVSGKNWSGRLDSNQRPPHPQYGALPSCATPRHIELLTIKNDQRVLAI